MSNGQSPEDWRRERALAALARAMRGEDEASPERRPETADPVNEWRSTAAGRHRLARQRREAGQGREPEAENRPAEAPDTMPPTLLEIVSRREDIVPPVPEAPPAGLAQDEVRTLRGDGALEDDVPTTPEPPAAAGEQPTGREEQPAPAEAFTADSSGSPLVSGSATPASAAPDPAGHGGKAQEKKPVVRARRGIAGSRPLILRLTLLGALIGIAAALLLWDLLGVLAAFLPLAGLFAGFAAGLAVAWRRPEIAVRANVEDAPPPRLAGHAQDDSPDGGQADSSGADPAGGNSAPPLGHPPSVEEIRASLRQFRAATQDLARQRARR